MFVFRVFGSARFRQPAFQRSWSCSVSVTTMCLASRWQRLVIRRKQQAYFPHPQKDISAAIPKPAPQPELFLSVQPSVWRQVRLLGFTSVFEFKIGVYWPCFNVCIDRTRRPVILLHCLTSQPERGAKCTQNHSNLCVFQYFLMKRSYTLELMETKWMYTANDVSGCYIEIWRQFSGTKLWSLWFKKKKPWILL